MNQISAPMAKSRDFLCRRLRSFLHEMGFVEINSPVLLRALPGNSDVRLSIGPEDYELRQCMELKLRSALSEGLSAVFEIGPCFRPSDLAAKHSHPEFYMLELFKSEIEYSELVELTRNLLIIASDNQDLQFEPINVSRWLEQELGVEILEDGSLVLSHLIERGLVPQNLTGLPVFHAVNHLLEKHLEKKCGTRERPALLYDYPACTICLARRSTTRPAIIKRFEVFVEGIEIAHGFVDEMDAEDVLTRMKNNGPSFVDEKFVELLRDGQLPPSAGVGFGIERLLITFGNVASIADFLHENQFSRFPTTF